MILGLLFTFFDCRGGDEFDGTVDTVESQLLADSSETSDEPTQPHAKKRRVEEAVIAVDRFVDKPFF